MTFKFFKNFSIFKSNFKKLSIALEIEDGFTKFSFSSNFKIVGLTSGLDFEKIVLVRQLPKFSKASVKFEFKVNEIE